MFKIAVGFNRDVGTGHSAGYVGVEPALMMDAEIALAEARLRDDTYRPYVTDPEDLTLLGLAFSGIPNAEALSITQAKATAIAGVLRNIGKKVELALDPIKVTGFNSTPFRPGINKPVFLPQQSAAETR